MLLPVFERFAELGWQPFVDPAETFELFYVSGVFRRANMNVTLKHGKQSGAENFVQRCALFDVCLKSGLAHLMVAYIRAEESQVQPKGAFARVKKYVLKEPIAVQQWLRRRLETTEQHVKVIVNDLQIHGHESPRTEEVNDELRYLNGLRMILIALTERLKEESRQAAHSFNNADAEGNIVDKTELIQLTSAGIQNLLQLLCRTHAAACACHCMMWLYENEVAAESEVYNAFYTKARSLRGTYRKQFEEIYGRKLSLVGGLKEPMLLIEHVMKSASISLNNLGGTCPPTQLTHLFELLSTSSIQADVVQFYGDEVDHQPIEKYFRVQVALLLYFCLDRAYLSVWRQQAQSGARIATKMRSLADSFASQLSVRGDMKLTLLALWLVENAVVVTTSGDDQVAAIYAYAVGLLQQSSAMHLHQKNDLEADVILHLLETLVHRGECLVAWKVWNTFGVELEQSPPAATELIVVISLELELWERALSLIRRQKRPGLLHLLFDWLMKSHRLKELVEGATLLPAEEKLFHTYMMESNVITDEDVLRDDNIKRVDFLVMYYILRNKYEQAWGVHHEHLAMIRAMSRGDTEIEIAALNQPSFHIRAALLSNMCLEPSPKPYSQRSKNVNMRTEFRQRQHPYLLKNEEMDDVSNFNKPAPTLSAPTDSSSMEVCTEDKQVTSAGSAFVCAKTENLTHSQEMAKAREFYYFPGIFSSQQGSGGPTRSMEPPTPLVDKMTPTPMKGRGQGKGSEGGTSAVSVDSSPNPSLQTLTKLNPFVSNSIGSARQALDFGSSPLKPSSAPSTPLQPFVSPFGDRRPLGTGPIRTKINTTFAFTSLEPFASKAPCSTNDLSLKPRNIESTTDDISPAEAQSLAKTMATEAPENRTVQQAVTPPDSASPVAAVTPKRYQFVRELSTDPRVNVAHSDSEYPISPATEKLEGMMEPEHIDEEFSTPISRSRGRRMEPASAPVRRNPRRTTRQKY